jgi:hypothetical protein
VQESLSYSIFRGPGATLSIQIEALLGVTGGGQGAEPCRSIADSCVRTTDAPFGSAEGEQITATARDGPHMAAISVLLGVLTIVVVGAICFWVIDIRVLLTI